MNKRVNMAALQELMQDALKIDQLRSRLKELSDAIQVVSTLQAELQKVLEGKQVGQAKARKTKGKKVGKQPYPKPGSAPERLCKILGQEPKTVQQVAKESGLKESTVRSYLKQFGCFKNVWGKGYVHKPQAHGKQGQAGK